MPTSAKLEALLQRANVPGISIAKISSDGVIASQRAGVINSETREAVTDHTLFQAASLTKPVFAYIVLKMVERGLFSRPGESPESGLDRPLHEICDFGPPELRSDPNYKLLTPRILLSHQAGLPNWFKRDERKAYVADPKTRFDYSGEGYCFLNDVVQHLSGKKPLHELSREIFDNEPLNMSHSGFIPPPEGSTELAMRALGHKTDGTPDKRPPPSGPILANPAASLVTTAEDYAKFLNACLHDEFIRRHMFEPQPSQLSLANRDQKAIDAGVSKETLRQMSWGIGMGLQTADTGDMIAFHWGDNETSRAFTAINLRTNEAAVCFTNSANGPALFRDIVEPVVGNLDVVSQWLSTREGLPIQQHIQIPLAEGNAEKVNITISDYPPGKKKTTFTYVPNTESVAAKPLEDVLLCYRDSSGVGQQVAMQKNAQGEWTAVCDILPNETKEFSIHPHLKPGELKEKPKYTYTVGLRDGKIIQDVNNNPLLPEGQKGRVQKFIYQSNGFLRGPVDEDHELGPADKLVDVYFPAGYQATSTQRYHLQVMLDGDLHLREDPSHQSMGTKNILDNLIAEGKMEPVIAVFIAPIPPTLEGHTPRLREYACCLETDQLLADLPKALRDSGIPVTTEPSKTSLCGQSMGGLQAIYTAKKHPDIYGQVIAQSPAVWWGPPEYRRKKQKAPDEVRVEQDETWRAPLTDEVNQQYVLKMIQTGKDPLTEQDLPQGSVQMQFQAGSLEDGGKAGEAPLKQDTIQLANEIDCPCIIHDGGHTPDAWASGLAIMLPIAHPKQQAPAPVEAKNCQDSAHQYRQVLSEFKAAAAARSSTELANTNSAATSARLPDMK